MANDMEVDVQLGREHTLYVNNLFEKISQDGECSMVCAQLHRSASSHTSQIF
jgi:hypothetical protein